MYSDDSWDSDEKIKINHIPIREHYMEEYHSKLKSPSKRISKKILSPMKKSFLASSTIDSIKPGKSKKSLHNEKSKKNN